MLANFFSQQKSLWTQHNCLVLPAVIVFRNIYKPVVSVLCLIIQIINEDVK